MGLSNIIMVQQDEDLWHYISTPGIQYYSFHLHRSNGGAAGPSTVLGEGLLVGVGALSGVGHAVLGLPVLGQVEGGDLLRLLDLLLVGLDLALQLVDEGLHPLMVLAVLVLLVAQLLDLALGLAHVLLGIGHAPVLGIQLRLELTDASVHLGHRLLAALEGLGLGLVDARLDVLDLGLQQLALPLKALSKVLLTAELISQPGGVDHGTLGLLLAEGGLSGHLVEVGGQSAHLRLDLHLGGLDGLVLAGLVAEGLVGVGKLLLNHTSGTVGLLQQSAGLLQGVLVGVALAVGNDQGVSAQTCQN